MIILVCGIIAAEESERLNGVLTRVGLYGRHDGIAAFFMRLDEIEETGLDIFNIRIEGCWREIFANMFNVSM